jgi:hypothetical protein
LKVNFAHVCDYASISREGKLSVMGIFAQVFAITLPGGIPMMYLAFEIDASASELDRPFKLEIRLADADGGIIASVEGEAAFGVLPGQTLPKGERAKNSQVMALGGLQLPKWGAYSFSIFLNGDLKIETGFTLTQGLPPGVQPPPGGLRR